MKRRMPPLGGLAAAVICATSSLSAASDVEAEGQERSGDVHPCHVTFRRVPKEALFMHKRPAARPLRAAATSEKKRIAISRETEKEGEDPSVTVPRPSDRNAIVQPAVFVEPLLTIVAPSRRGVAPATSENEAKSRASVARDFIGRAFGIPRGTLPGTEARPPLAKRLQALEGTLAPAAIIERL